MEDQESADDVNFESVNGAFESLSTELFKLRSPSVPIEFQRACESLGEVHKNRPDWIDDCKQCISNLNDLKAVYNSVISQIDAAIQQVENLLHPQS